MSVTDARSVLFTLLCVQHGVKTIEEAVATARSRLSKKDIEKVEAEFKALVEGETK
jgi:hypothetical protein